MLRLLARQAAPAAARPVLAAATAASRRGATSVFLPQPVRRGFSTLSQLQRKADMFPADAARQAEYLVKLGQRDPAAVVERFESQQYAWNPDVVKEYLLALGRQGRMSEARLPPSSSGIPSSVSRLDQAVTSSAEAGQVPRFRSQLRGDGGSGSGSGSQYGGHASSIGGASARLGTETEPLHIALPEASAASQFWKTVRMLGLTFLLLSAVNVILEDKGPQGISKNMGLGDGKNIKPIKETNVRFADVKGCDEAVDELQEIVSFLKQPADFVKLGAKLPKGVMMVGPPGTGKTMLARAVAGEAGVPFYYISGSEFDEMFVGVGARRVRDLFTTAKASGEPCIIFIDEIDAVGGSRNNRDSFYVKMTLNQLLVEMDGFSPNDKVVVIAATNFPESLDKALVRPGRFDKMVAVSLPDMRGREDILKVHAKDVPLAESVKLSVVARGTPGFSGADLANLVNLASLRASKLNHDHVLPSDLDHAKDRILMGSERKSMLQSEQDRRLTAYHESGHALVALYCDGADPVHKATIMPRGMALGMVVQLPEQDRNNYTRKQLLAQMDVSMGGRVAEEMIFGRDNVTTGASSDLSKATKVARAMVTQLGMGTTLGPSNYDEDAMKDLSSESRQRVEQEVRQLLDESYARARKVLESNRDDLHRLAKALLEHETLTGEQVLAAAKGRKIPNAT